MIPNPAHQIRAVIIIWPFYPSKKLDLTKRDRDYSSRRENNQAREKKKTIYYYQSMVDVHDRMPVIVAEHEVRPYLTNQAMAEKIIATAAPVLSKQEANPIPKQKSTT